MNDRAREALVEASLKGVNQIKRAYKTDKGQCALGVLLEKTGWYEEFWIPCVASEMIRSEFEMSNKELKDIVYANDVLGWDFLTIARKIGTQEETQEA
jgi:hypothetical protein